MVSPLKLRDYGFTNEVKKMKKQRWTVTLLLAAGAFWRASGQTTVDLSRQGKLGTGTILPAQCTVGQIFFKTDAPAGSNLYACATPNTWAVMGLPVLGGDASGNQQSVTVKGIQGRGVSAAAPADQNVLRWNAAAGQWEPDPVLATGSALPPGTCVAGSLYLLSDAANNVQQLYVCSNTNTWSMASFRSGPAASRPANCVAGQTWLSTDTGAMTYCSVTGNPGTWSATLAGPPGANGNTILSGAAVPSAGTGANGDFYLDTATDCLYGPKASGVWPGSCASLLGGGAPIFTATSGRSTLTVANTATGITQSTVEPSCGTPHAGTSQNGQCLVNNLSGLFNPANYGNLTGSYLENRFYNGRNTINDSDKKTISGYAMSNNFFASGQKFGLNMNVRCEGAGDCFGVVANMTYGNSAPANGDEGVAAYSSTVHQERVATVITTIAPVKSSCAISALAGSVVKSTNPTDIKTVSVTGSTAACFVGDQLTIDNGVFGLTDTNVENVTLTAVGASTISALFYADHTSGKPVAPSITIASVDGYLNDAWGQDRIVVDLTVTPYATGQAAVLGGINSTTVTGSGGASWSVGMVGGNVNLPGCIKFAADTQAYSGSSFDSWFPIQAVVDGTHITLYPAYTGSQTSAGSYVIRPCARIANIAVTYNAADETLAGAVLYSNNFPWTTGNQVEQTLSPHSNLQKIIGAEWAHYGPIKGGNGPNMFQAMNAGAQTALSGLRIMDTGMPAGRAAYAHPIIVESDFLNSGLQFTGRNLSGVNGASMAMTTYASVSDNKKIAWGIYQGTDGNGAAEIYPDLTTGAFTIDARKSGKLTLAKGLLDSSTLTLNYSGVNASRVLMVPDFQAATGILGVLRGTIATNDCLRYAADTSVISAGGPCSTAAAAGAAGVLQMSDGSGGFSAAATSRLLADSIANVHIYQGGSPGGVSLSIDTQASDAHSAAYDFVRDGSSGYLTINGTQTTNSGYVFQTGAGSTKMVIQNSGLVSLAGTTNAFPALKRSSTTLAVRLADDSGDAPMTASTLGVGGAACKIRSGSGSPEAAVTGNVCDLYLRTDGGPGTTMYVKESGTGDTGWVGK
jgi:hypothetical protein